MFGQAWEDVDANGCNQRDDVLWASVDKSMPHTKERQGTCDHDMIAGTWHDSYTGSTLVFTDLKDSQQAQAIQIDHVVPLAAAYRYGADEWSTERKVAFANDLDNLLAVDGPTNASKGASDPAAWRPRKAAQCDYAVRYVNTKTKWGLPTDTSEKAALDDMLGTCG